MYLDKHCRLTLHDEAVGPVGEVGTDLLTVGHESDDKAWLVIDGDSPLTKAFMECRARSLTIIAERDSERAVFKVCRHDYEFRAGKWTGRAELVRLPGLPDPGETPGSPVSTAT